MKKSTKAKILMGVMGLSLLAGGCKDSNYDLWDTEYSFSYAVTFNADNKRATIIPIESWTDYDGEQIQIKTIDGAVYVTSSFDTKIYDQAESSISVEDFVRIKAGEDVEISYLTEEYALKMN